MVERQPGRPTEGDFMRAALRFTEDNYEVVPIHSPFNLGVIQFIRPGKAADMKIIKNEHKWQGLRGEEETLEVFAIRQLAWYRAHRS
ncbi:MAG TPA: hypothetical protein VGE13_02210 [Candidatus Saccharimonadales bacterium]